MSHNNHDKTIKNTGVIFLSVIVFALIYNALLGGNGFNAYMAYGRTGYGLGGSLSVTLALVIKLLFLGVIVAVAAAVVAAIKNQGLDNIDLSFIDKLFDNGHHRKYFCPHCRREIEHSWKHCPYCGASPKKENKKKKHDTQDSVHGDPEVHGAETSAAETSAVEILAKEDCAGTVTGNLEPNRDATLTDNDDRQVEGRESDTVEQSAGAVEQSANAAEQSANAVGQSASDVSTAKTGSSKKTKPKKNGKAKK